MSILIVFNFYSVYMDKETATCILEQETRALCSLWVVSKSDKRRIVFTCKDKNCGFRVGYSQGKSGWRKIRTWNSLHKNGCMYSKPIRQTIGTLRRRAVHMAAVSGNLTTDNVMLMYKYVMRNDKDLSNRGRRQLQNATYYARRVMGFLGMQLGFMFTGYLESLRSDGYHVSIENKTVCIITPYCRKLIKSFHAPLFLDGTVTDDHACIIHICCVTTTNVVILLGLVMCKTEDSKSVEMLLKKSIEDQTVTIISDEGKGIQKGIKELGARCKHMLCTWHLAKSLPDRPITNNEGDTYSSVRDLFYSTARGTGVTYEYFYRTISFAPDSRRKLHRIRTQWCRRFSSGMRRGYIASLSECINAAVKRISKDHSLTSLTKEFINQSFRTYESCKETAHVYATGDYMPDVLKYYEKAFEAKKNLSYIKKDESYHVFHKGREIAVVAKENERYICSCNQHTDVGLVCCHILSIEDVDISQYTHDIWKTKTFLDAFQIEDVLLPKPSGSFTQSQNTNQGKIIKAVKNHETISNRTTSTILKILDGI